MANVLARTVTALPDVPYWRAAGTPDCMVILYFCTKVNDTHNEK